MKKIILVLILCSQIAAAQNKLELSDGERPLRFQEIIESNETKDALWAKTKMWTAKSFNNPEVVIVMDDKELGIIKLRYITEYKINGTQNKFYNSILLEIKEGKVRITITDISLVKDGKTLEAYLLKKDNSFWNSGFLEKFRADIEAKNTLLISDYKKAIKTSNDF